MKKILAVASAGGHWQQLMIVKDAFKEGDAHFVTTLDGLPQKEGINDFSIVSDCNRNAMFKTFYCVFKIFFLVLRLRPDYVVSTGALPGVVALFIGSILGKKTIWIDSVANAECLSMSGRLAKKYSTLHLSQWEHVANLENTNYMGRVL